MDSELRNTLVMDAEEGVPLTALSISKCISLYYEFIIRSVLFVQRQALYFLSVTSGFCTVVIFQISIG
jgi:hypothetical protein